LEPTEEQDIKKDFQREDKIQKIIPEQEKVRKKLLLVRRKLYKGVKFG